MADAFLKLAGVNVFYGAIHALKDVTFSLQKGEIATLIGANGAGKTTILKTISALLRPRSGTIELESRPIHQLAAHEVVAAGVAQAPEGRGIFANMTVAENLDLGAYLRRDKAGVAAVLDRVFGLFPILKERFKQSAGTLSGGEQQMLAIGRALMARPQILLLDEPSLGLAPQLVQTIFRIIQEVNKAGTTILLVEQNAHMALAIAHHAYVLETGRIVLGGTAAEVAQSDAVRKAYLGE